MTANKKNEFSDTRIAITGSFGFKDIGDEAMLSEYLDFISALGFQKKNILLLGSEPDYISYYHNHPIKNCLSTEIFNRESRPGIISKLKTYIKTQPAISRCKDMLKECDVFLITGGGTVNTRDECGRSLRRMHGLVVFFHSLGTPIFMSGQTIGPLGLYPAHDRLAAHLLKCVDFLTVRDNYYSKRYTDIIQAKPKKFVETYDDASAIRHEEVELPVNLCAFVESRKSFVVNVTDYTSDSANKRYFMADLCEYVIKTFNINVVLLSHTPKDFFSLHQIYDMVNNTYKGNIIIPDTRLWRGEALKKLISKTALAIGGRYHFIVFSGTSGTPFIGLNGNHYSYIKQNGFAKMIGKENFILTEKETWNMEILSYKIEEALKTNFKLDKPVTSGSMDIFHSWLKEKL